MAGPALQAPRTVYWEVTNRCNLACGTCYNKQFLNNKRNTLGRDEGERRCHEMIANQVKSVIFLGGEPLADKNIFHYIKILRSAGIECSISTNGTLITPPVAEQIASLGVKMIAVSLDGGTPAENDRVRGAGSFERILRGLDVLVRGRVGDRPRITVAITLTEQNVGDFQSFFQAMAARGIVDIFVNKYSKVNDSSLSTGSARDFLIDLDRLCAAAAQAGQFYLYLPTMPRIADFLTERHAIYVSAKEQSCNAVNDAVLLADDGKLYPCSMARATRGEFAKPYVADWRDGAIASLMADFLQEKARVLSTTPEVCRQCNYRDTCAQKCVLTEEQTKYHTACESFVDLLETLWRPVGCLEMSSTP